MLEIIVDKHILFILMGVFAVLGILSKLIANFALKGLVKAAGNMNKSNHTLMRLVRAKFEHACMISDKVQNVGVFVDKYLYEYKTVGLKLHTWRRLEKGTAWMCLILGIGAAGTQYLAYGMDDQVLKSGAAGAGAAILLVLLHMTTDEKYMIGAAKNYMVDYLENVCARRYEKAYQKEIQVMAPPETPIPEVNEPKTYKPEVQEPERLIQGVEEPEPKEPVIDEPERPHPRTEVPSPDYAPEITPPVMPEPNHVPTPQPQIQASRKSAKELRRESRRNAQKEMQKEAQLQLAKDVQKELQESRAEKEKEEIREEIFLAEDFAQEQKEIEKETKNPISKEVLIREILEEFLA